MAAPNIVNVTSIFGRTASLTPANTTANVLLANPADSNKVFKVNMIIAANADNAANQAATVAINSNAAGSGTSTSIATALAVPTNASLIVSDKATAFYLEENRSIVVTSGAASKVSFTVSYDDIA
jgi:hypothetical protein